MVGASPRSRKWGRVGRTCSHGVSEGGCHGEGQQDGHSCRDSSQPLSWGGACRLPRDGRSAGPEVTGGTRPGPAGPGHTPQQSHPPRKERAGTRAPKPGSVSGGKAKPNSSLAAPAPASASGRRPGLDVAEQPRGGRGKAPRGGEAHAARMLAWASPPGAAQQVPAPAARAQHGPGAQTGPVTGAFGGQPLPGRALPGPAPGALRSWHLERLPRPGNARFSILLKNIWLAWHVTG